MDLGEGLPCAGTSKSHRETLLSSDLLPQQSEGGYRALCWLDWPLLGYRNLCRPPTRGASAARETSTHLWKRGGQLLGLGNRHPEGSLKQRGQTPGPGPGGQNHTGRRTG